MSTAFFPKEPVPPVISTYILHETSSRMRYAFLRPINPGFARVQRKLDFDYMGKKYLHMIWQTLISKVLNSPL